MYDSLQAQQAATTTPEAASSPAEEDAASKAASAAKEKEDAYARAVKEKEDAVARASATSAAFREAAQADLKQGHKRNTTWRPGTGPLQDFGAFAPTPVPAQVGTRNYFVGPCSKPSS